MKNSTVIVNVYYLTWLVDLAFLDADERDLFNHDANYVRSEKENDERFLQKGIVSFFGFYSIDDLESLMLIYAEKRLYEGAELSLYDAIVDWLNHTMAISKDVNQELYNWCKSFNVEKAINRLRLPDYTMIKRFDPLRGEYLERIKFFDHFKELSKDKGDSEIIELKKGAILKAPEGIKVVTKKYLSTEEVAKILSVSRKTLWSWNIEGYLTHSKVGRKNVYLSDDVEKILTKK